MSCTRWRGHWKNQYIRPSKQNELQLVWWQKLPTFVLRHILWKPIYICHVPYRLEKIIFWIFFVAKIAFVAALFATHWPIVVKISHKCHVLNEVNTWWKGRRKEEHDFFRIQLEKPSYIKFCLGLCNWQLQNVCVTYIVSIGLRCNQVILYLHDPVDNNILFFAPSECSVYSTAIRCLINLVYYFSDIYMC